MQETAIDDEQGRCRQLGYYFCSTTVAVGDGCTVTTISQHAQLVESVIDVVAPVIEVGRTASVDDYRQRSVVITAAAGRCGIEAGRQGTTGDGYSQCTAVTAVVAINEADADVSTAQVGQFYRAGSGDTDFGSVIACDILQQIRCYATCYCQQSAAVLAGRATCRITDTTA